MTKYGHFNKEKVLLFLFVGVVIDVFLFSCSFGKSEVVNIDLIEFDVAKEYPVKEWNSIYASVVENI